MRHVSDGELHALLDGELDGLGPQVAREVRAHLEQCDPCRLRLEDEAELRDEAAALLAGDDPLAGLELPSLAELRRAAAVERTGRWTGASWRMAAGWAATVVISLGVGYGLGVVTGPEGVGPRAAPARQDRTTGADEVGDATGPDAATAAGEAMAPGAPGAPDEAGAPSAAMAPDEVGAPDAAAGPGAVAASGEAASGAATASGEAVAPRAAPAPATARVEAAGQRAAAEDVAAAPPPTPASDSGRPLLPGPGVSSETGEREFVMAPTAFENAPATRVRVPVLEGRQVADAAGAADAAAPGARSGLLDAPLAAMPAAGRGREALERDGLSPRLALPGFAVENVDFTRVWDHQAGVIVRQLRVTDGVTVELRVTGALANMAGAGTAPPARAADLPEGWRRVTRQLEAGWADLRGPLPAEVLEDLLDELEEGVTPP